MKSCDIIAVLAVRINTPIRSPPFAPEHPTEHSTAQHMATVAVGGAASSGDSGNACKRLQKELMALMMSTDDGISAFPDSDNMLLWCCARPGHCMVCVRVRRQPRLAACWPAAAHGPDS